jgi:anti-anti-sigma regulatory factor
VRSEKEASHDGCTTTTLRTPGGTGQGRDHHHSGRGPAFRLGNRIAQQLQGLADEPGRGALVLDFRNVESLNSNEVCTLIALHRKLKVSGGRLTLGNVPPHLYEVFERTRLDRWLDVRRGPLFRAASVA